MSEHDLIRVGDYWQRDLALEATCRCGHRRMVPAAFLVAMFGQEQRLDERRLALLAQRFRCSSCQRHEARLEVVRSS